MHHAASNMRKGMSSRRERGYEECEKMRIMYSDVVRSNADGVLLRGDQGVNKMEHECARL